ncbi:MAG: TolC family protein [Acidobacteriota bacterium]|nr:TolC family protein [Acidobacteriota bacterium]
MTKIINVCAFVLLTVAAFAQQPITALKSLIAEAQQNNTAIKAADRQIQSSEYGPRQASAFPDTEITIQSFTVGSPRPFAGYSNSDFAYIGFGASQEIPYPGKRSLRATVAQHEITISRADKNAVVWAVLTRLKLAYFQLASSEQIISVLEKNQHFADQIEQASEARYRTGVATQHEVLRTQLERTKVLNVLAAQQRESRQAQVLLKALLNRRQDSADVLTERLSVRHIANTETLFVKLRQSNPDVQVTAEHVSQSQAAVELAKREKKPDFGVQYMWQHTSDNFRDYYMGTFSLKLPNRSRVRAVEGESRAKVAQAEAEKESKLSQTESDLGEQVAIVQTSEQQLRVYDEGLIPQSEATLNAGLAEYGTGKQEYQSLLASFADTLQLSIDRERTLAEHEAAIARIEGLIGEELQ